MSNSRNLNNKRGGDPLIATMTSACLFYLGYRLWPGPNGDDTQKLIAVMILLIGIGGLFRVFSMVRQRYLSLLTLIRAFRPDDDCGSASWLTERELRKAKLHRTVPGARLVGVVGKSPLFLFTETHSLIIAPAGSGKSSTVIALMLCSNANSALISDIKGELCEQFAEFRAKEFDHRIIIHDPTDPDSASFNPLDKIHVLVMDDSPDALTWVRGMTNQLYPEPPKEGENRFFRDGARLDITTLILAVVVVCPPELRNMSSVYRALVDEDYMNDLLLEAAKCELLGGEISMMADNWHRMAFGDDRSSNVFQQFRMGAVQRIQVFGPGNHLVKISQKSDFSFRQLKEEKLSIFLKVDFRNKEVLGPWVGLLQWFAAQELIEVGNNTPVEFILDEFCNAPVRQLPEILTLFRSYGVKVAMATQDLGDIKRVYGENAYETIESEADIKQFLGGIRSQRTTEYTSKALGEDTINISSYSAVDDSPQESISRTGRRLLDPNEIRQMPSDEQIIIYANFKPISARKVSIFACDPWRTKINPNTMYGSELRLDPVQIEIGSGQAKVLRRGYWRVPEKRNLRPLFWPVLSAFLPPGSILMVLAALVFVHWAGFPYLLTSYSYSGYGKHRIYHECRYSGPKPFTTRGECSLFKLRKVW